MKMLWDSGRALADQIIACDHWLEPHRDAVARVADTVKAGDRSASALSKLIGDEARNARRSALTYLLTRDQPAWNARAAEIAQIREAAAANPDLVAAVD